MNSGQPGITHASQRLVATLKDCEARAASGTLTLGEVLDSVQEAGFSFICIILVLPFLQPFSLGPLAMAGGLTFAALGWQYLRGHHSPVLPARLRAAAPGPKAWRLMLEACVKLLSWCSRFSRPRRSEWVTGQRGHRMVGWILIAGGLLMAIPFFGLPFNNFLPGMAIFFICVGQLERDGMLVFVALGWLVLTVIYFAAVLIALWALGAEALHFM